MDWIFQLPVLSFSVIVHEVSHGWAAFLKGDRTAEDQGRLTLNPIPHIDPFGTLFLPLLCYFVQLPMFGWAKPVPVTSSRMRRPRIDMIHVACAGPCANLALALGMAVAFKLSAVAAVFAPEFQKTLQDALLFGVTINLILAFFNLIPVHPLDGSKVLGGLLPAAWRARYYRHVPYGFYILLFLMMTPLMHSLVVLPARAALAGLARLGLVTW